MNARQRATRVLPAMNNRHASFRHDTRIVGCAAQRLCWHARTRGMFAAWQRLPSPCLAATTSIVSSISKRAIKIEAWRHKQRHIRQNVKRIKAAKMKRNGKIAKSRRKAKKSLKYEQRSSDVHGATAAYHQAYQWRSGETSSNNGEASSIESSNGVAIVSGVA